jgi:hyperosmotically inducible periplasmic protein
MKMKGILNRVAAAVAAVVIATSAAVAAPAKADPAAEQRTAYEQLAKKVRKELVTLPWYGVFDNLAYEIDGSTVKLYGQVVRPTTRTDAERRVRKLAGVERVENNIEVLPLSSFDDSIRVRTYRTLYGWNSPLFRYGRGVNPSIHIVVNRGHLTLEGVVANEGDRRLAYIMANSVPGVFSVTNNLRAENERAR